VGRESYRSSIQETQEVLKGSLSEDLKEAKWEAMTLSVIRNPFRHWNLGYNQYERQSGLKERRNPKSAQAPEEGVQEGAQRAMEGNNNEKKRVTDVFLTCAFGVFRIKRAVKKKVQVSEEGSSKIALKTPLVEGGIESWKGRTSSGRADTRPPKESRKRNQKKRYDAQEMTST